MGAPVDEGFGSVVGRLRRRAGLSQRDLAKRCGLSVATIRDLEQARVRAPRPRTVKALVAGLELTESAAAAVHELAAAAWTANRAGREDGGGDSGYPGPAAQPTPTGPLRIGVLGPLTVHLGPTPVRLHGRRLRALLARLALSANSVVSVPDLVAVLWGDRPPRAPVGAVQAHISRLRTALATPGSAPPLSFDAAGYRLGLADEQLDLTEFRALVRRAAAEPPLRAIDMFEGALERWRGDPLVDVDELHDHPQIAALWDEYVAATLRHAELAEACGQPERGIHWLRGLADRQPLHEPVHARLITLLAATGRQADALAVGHAIRRRLADELGIDPGPALARAYQAVLVQQAGTATQPRHHDRLITPAQLPAGVPAFTGRAEQLTELDRLLAGLGPTGNRPTAVVISAIDGTAGVGKTALAVHWCHRVRSRFPDGQLYVNLLGFDQSGRAMEPEVAIRGFLSALNVNPRRIPPTLDAQAALYRSLLADRRMLVLLDNARDSEQVRQLLPGAPGCLVVVTSRNRLTGLVAANAAHPLTLDLLSVDEAREFLTRRLGGQRTRAESSAADDIIEACSRLPLALAIVSARAATRPQLSLVALAAQLRHRDRRLSTLRSDAPSHDLRAVFSWSYHALTPPAARLFRLLGLHTGPSITTQAAASLCALTEPAAAGALAELVQSNLIVEHSPDRYVAHDLLRAYATQLVRELDADEQRRDATHRLLDHYAHTSCTAALLLDPFRSPLTPPPPRPGVVPTALDGAATAMAWFDAESEAMIAMISHLDDEWDSYRWQLSWALTDYLDRHGRWRDWAAVAQASLAATQRSGQPSHQALAHRLLARVQIRLGQLDEAGAHLRRALELYRDGGDHREVGNTYVNLAQVFERQGRHVEAIDTVTRALEPFRMTGDRRAEATVLNAIGWCSAQLGDHERATRACEQALALFQEVGDRHGEAQTWDSIGYAHHGLGDHGRAVRCYEAAIDLYVELGEQYLRADVLTHLGATEHAAGDHEAARRAWRRALTILDELDHPEADDVRDLLASLDG
jgi:DNA-binding SARP family transcriptional activator/tetratricopeptide (TPR) repeat protein/transcriptional regulator with XRE-family HTH domain